MFNLSEEFKITLEVILTCVLYNIFLDHILLYFKLAIFVNVFIFCLSFYFVFI